MSSAMDTTRGALVTGAAHGIGAAIVWRLAATGVCRFLLVDRDAPALQALAAELQAAGGAALPLALDLGDAQALRNGLRTALRDFGALDIVVNNAGVATENEPDDHATWQQVMAVNLEAPFLVTALALQALRDHGRIVNVSSILGRAGKLRNTAYCASKHGLLGYTKALALDLAMRRITVNAVLPGWVDTPLLRRELAAQAGQLGVRPQDIERNARKQVPLKRFVGCDEVAAMVAYLCGAEAAGITAQSFVIDGGATCGM
jgi:3-hydroxybutyrate dehydrogenase